MDAYEELQSVKSEPELFNLIVNYIPKSISQDDLKRIFAKIGPVASCKLVKNHSTGESLGYGFIQYMSKEDADQAVVEVSGVKIESKTLRVSHAKPVDEVTDDVNVYVAGIPHSMDEAAFRATFIEFGDVLMTKILYNNDQTSRGAGFVRYKHRDDAHAAITAMNGKTLTDGIMPLNVKLAIPPASKRGRSDNRYNPLASNRDQPSSQMGTSSIPVVNQLQTLQASSALPGAGAQVYSIYAYGLQTNHSELTLYELFAPHGAVQSVKMMRDMTKEGLPSKGFGFVNYLKYEDAVQAIAVMNGKEFDGKQLQVAFKTAKGSQQTDPNVLANIAAAQQPQVSQFALLQLQQLQAQNQQALLSLQNAGYSTQQLAAAGLSTSSLGGLAGLGSATALQQHQALQPAAPTAGLPAGLPAGFTQITAAQLAAAGLSAGALAGYQVAGYQPPR